MRQSGLSAARRSSTLARIFPAILPAATAVLVALIVGLPSAMAGPVHTASSTTLTAPYKRTAGYTLVTSIVDSCAKGKSVPGEWNASSGVFSGSVFGTAKTCAKIVGSAGWVSGVTEQVQEAIGIPFRVTSGGSHVVVSHWTASISSSRSIVAPTCPPKNIPPPGNYLYAECSAYALTAFFYQATIIDLNDSGWLNAGGNGVVSNSTWSLNQTTCNPSSGCYTYFSNTTQNVYTGYGSAGVRGLHWNGLSNFKIWDNGTSMVSSHHYVLVLSFTLEASADTAAIELLGTFPASASVSINMGSLGNGATLNSVVIN
jgi:hypothetical protein